MEKSYGIEAARAQLGDIADHARTTGEVVALTRHGRTVAVIGPAEAVKPTKGVQVYLHFPHTGLTVSMAAVPRKGEFLGIDTDDLTGRWEVTEVEYTVYPDQVGSIGITLDPADEAAKRKTER